MVIRILPGSSRTQYRALFRDENQAKTNIGGDGLMPPPPPPSPWMQSRLLVGKASFSFGAEEFEFVEIGFSTWELLQQLRVHWAYSTKSQIWTRSVGMAMRKFFSQQLSDLAVQSFPLGLLSRLLWWWELLHFDDVLFDRWLLLVNDENQHRESASDRQTWMILFF